MQAFGKHILFKPVMKEKANKILTLHSEKPIYWEVLSIGSKVEGLSVGDKCVLKDHFFTEITYEDKQYLFGTEDSLWAKLN